MPKTMPKQKSKPQFIDNQLAEKCKKLLETSDKRDISQKTGYSISHINFVIAGDRYNKEIIKELKKRVDTIIKELSK